MHVTAKYEAPDARHKFGQIVVGCEGWNGAKIRCAGQQYALEKGNSWVSTRPEAEIMLDVLDCRVMINWPILEQDESRATPSLRPWAEEESPRATRVLDNHVLPSSPPPMLPVSPNSPSPARPSTELPSVSVTTVTSSLDSNATAVQIYEDATSDHVHDLEYQKRVSQPRVPKLARLSIPVTRLPGLGKAQKMEDDERKAQRKILSAEMYET